MRKKVTSLILVLSFLVTVCQCFTEANALDDTTEPELLSLTVVDSTGKSIELLESKKSVHLGETYTFKAEFSNSRLIDKVFITSTKNGETKLLEAEWNGSVFSSKGLFDEDEKNYIPGKIGVKYLKKVNDFEVSEDIDWAPMQEVFEGQTAATIQTVTDKSLQADIDISQLIEDELGVVVQVSIDVFDATNDSSLDEFLGMYKEVDKLTKYALSDGNYDVYVDSSKPSSYATIVKDVTGNRWIKTVLTAAESDELDTIVEKLGSISKLSTLASNYLKVSEYADDMREELEYRADISEEEKEELNDKLDAYEQDRQMFDLAMVVIPAAVAASGGLAAGPAIAFTALLGIVNAASDTFWEYRLGMIVGGETESVFANSEHGIPLSKSGKNYIQENGTYYATNTSEIVVKESLEVTICKHGQRILHITNNGGTVHICDCQYDEETDASSPSATKYDEVVNIGGVVTVENGSFAVSTEENGEVIVNGGKAGIRALSGSVVDVYDGTVTDLSNRESSFTLHDGTVKKAENYGTVQIFNGNFDYIENNAGTVGISGGIIGKADESGVTGRKVRAVTSRGGTVTIKGGEIIGEIFCAAGSSQGGSLTISGGTIRGSIAGGGSTTTTINGGTFYSETDYSVQVGGTEAYLTISGGSFYTENGTCINISGNNETMSTGGTAVINGGSFYSANGSCITNSGYLTVNDGVFISEGNSDKKDDACLINLRNATAMLCGGTFYKKDGGCIINTESSDRLCISGGKFVSKNVKTGIYGKSCNIQVDQGTEVEINSQQSAFESSQKDNDILITVEAGNYSGGIIYYDFENVNGIKTSVSDAGKLKFSGPYVRIATSANVDSGSSYTGELIKIEDLDSRSRFAWLGLYAVNGCLTGIVPCEVFDKQGVAFVDSELYSCSAHIRVFQLTEKYAPLCAVKEIVKDQ